MNVIRFSNEDVMSFLGGSQKKVKSFKYRFNKYLVRTEYSEDEEVWYNSFTGSVVSIKDYEADNVFTEDFCTYADYLIQNYFLVPENFDEESLFLEYRKRKTVPITANALTRLKTFTILTTTQCNARCFYCYQLHNKGKKHMSVETANKVARYIIDSTFEGQDVFFGWFGGEPLYNPKVIDIITTKVMSANRRVSSSMITNGYLLNEKMCKKAVKDWYITNVQITLDGTEDVYNKTKHYIYKDDASPFKTVIKNIHYMLKEGLNVTIRINVDLHNIEVLENLINFLAEEFKGEENFHVYAHELFDEDNLRTPEHNKQVFSNLRYIENKITDLGLRIKEADVPGTIKTLHCMVDDDSSIIITPDGSLGLCEHYEAGHFVGHIDNPTDLDMDEVRAWREMSEYTEICEDCPIKPACLKCKLCPDHNICNVYEKEYVLNKINSELKVIYKDWIERQSKNENTSCSCK